MIEPIWIARVEDSPSIVETRDAVEVRFRTLEAYLFDLDCRQRKFDCIPENEPRVIASILSSEGN